jgi:hypothetical protein
MNFFKMLMAGLQFALKNLHLFKPKDDEDDDKDDQDNGGNGNEDSPVPLKDVIWCSSGTAPLHTFKNTFKLTHVNFGNGTISWGYNQYGQSNIPTWRGTGSINQNPNACIGFIYKDKDGKWYGAVGEWLRPHDTRQALKVFYSERHGKHLFKGHMRNFKPHKGQEMYIFVCGLNWLNLRNVLETSQLFPVTYPYNG